MNRQDSERPLENVVMTDDEFWAIIERVHALSPDDMELKCANLAAALRAGPLDEVVSFERHFRR